jgi:hypothetical protein
LIQTCPTGGATEHGELLSLATFLFAKVTLMSRVTPLGGLLFAAVLVWCPWTIASAQTLDRPHSDLEPGVDSSVKPGDDFFAYANGSWLRATEIPAGKDRWNARDEISELTRQQVAKLLDDAGAEPVGPTAQTTCAFISWTVLPMCCRVPSPSRPWPCGRP